MYELIKKHRMTARSDKTSCRNIFMISIGVSLNHDTRNTISQPWIFSCKEHCSRDVTLLSLALLLIIFFHPAKRLSAICSSPSYITGWRHPSILNLYLVMTERGDKALLKNKHTHVQGEKVSEIDLRLSCTQLFHRKTLCGVTQWPINPHE